MLYIREKLKPIVINLVTNHELICINVNLNIKIRLVLVYWKPKQNIQLDEDCMKPGLVWLKKVFIVIGDFNSPSINWESLSSNTEESQLLTFYNDNFLTQFVHEPTREHNILDLILPSEENIVSDVVIDSPLSTSDHNIVQFKIKSLYFYENNRKPIRCKIDQLKDSQVW